MVTRLVMTVSVLLSDLVIAAPDPVLGLYAGAGALLGYCANGGVRV